MKYPQSFINRLHTSDNILIFTGAGISAESGIETFRGKGGLWNKMKPEELASFNGFIKNPNLVWEWYQYRRKIVRETKPNPGHYAITELEKYYKSVSVVTQNVDNLHSRAGSTNVIELHGNIERNFCISCNTFYGEKDFLSVKEAPNCPKCGGMIRPDVVWFGENLPDGVFEKAELLARESDICFIVGTSAVVYPAAYIPITAKEFGAYLVEINIEKTEISSMVDFSLIGNSGEILPNILETIKEIKK